MTDFASPAARELAAQHGLDASKLTGTGSNGAITAADVRAALADDGDRPVPAILNDAGRDLWTRIIGDLADGWELDARELVDLERACVCADRLAELDRIVDQEGMITTGSKGQTRTNPALDAARHLELVQHRLLASLQLADPASASASSPTSQRKRRAAQARWDRQARTEARRADIRTLHRHHVGASG